jgi:hypothetical protein
MLAGSMNNDNDNVIDISDSDSDFDFDFDSDDPASPNVAPGENGEGKSVMFQDEESTPSSSSRGIKNSNGQYRTLPSSFASAIDAEKARYTLGSGDRTYPRSNSQVWPRHDSERATLSSSRRGSAGLAVDAKDNKNGLLSPSFSNGSTSKSTHPNVASDTRMLPSRFTNGNSQRLGDNKMGTHVAKEIGQPSSSGFPSQSSSVSNAQKVNMEDDDGMYNYSQISLIQSKIVNECKISPGALMFFPVLNCQMMSMYMMVPVHIGCCLHILLITLNLLISMICKLIQT